MIGAAVPRATRRVVQSRVCFATRAAGRAVQGSAALVGGSGSSRSSDRVSVVAVGDQPAPDILTLKWYQSLHDRIPKAFRIPRPKYGWPPT